MRIRERIYRYRSHTRGLSIHPLKPTDPPWLGLQVLPTLIPVLKMAENPKDGAQIRVTKKMFRLEVEDTFFDLSLNGTLPELTCLP